MRSQASLATGRLSSVQGTGRSMHHYHSLHSISRPRLSSTRLPDDPPRFPCSALSHLLLPPLLARLPAPALPARLPPPPPPDPLFLPPPTPAFAPLPPPFRRGLRSAARSFGCGGRAREDTSGQAACLRRAIKPLGGEGQDAAHGWCGREQAGEAVRGGGGGGGGRHTHHGGGRGEGGRSLRGGGYAGSGGVLGTRAEPRRER